MKTTDAATIFSDAIEALVHAGLNLTDMRLLTYLNAFPGSNIEDAAAGTGISESDVTLSLNGNLARYLEGTDFRYHPNTLGRSLLEASLTDMAACSAIAPGSSTLTGPEFAQWDKARKIILDYVGTTDEFTVGERLARYHHFHLNPSVYGEDDRSEFECDYMNIRNLGIRMTCPGEAAYMNLDLLFSRNNIEVANPLKKYRAVIEKANQLGLCLW